MASTSTKIISTFPDQVSLGFDQKIPDFPFNIKDIENIVVCGMGGSAMAGEFLKRFYPLNIHKSYNLPTQFINKKTLVVCLSYSGNTEETLSAYSLAVEKKLPLVVISSGGLIKDKANTDNIPFIEIRSKGIEPRMSVVEQICLLKNLLSTLKIKDILVDSFNIDKENIDLNKFLPIVNETADLLVNKVPIIYASSDNTASAVYWKAMFNENAKVPAFWNVFPEVNHNELMQGVGIDWPEKFHVINIIDENDHPRIQKRMKFTGDIFKRKGFGVSTIKLEGDSSLEKIINSITLGNLTSISLAEKLGLDPIDPDVREEFKKEMRSVEHEA